MTMPARILSVVFTTAFLTLPVLPVAQAAPPDAETIACRALEAHTDNELKVTAIVFHQRDQVQRAELATLLRGHSGEWVEVQAADGTWRRAHMLRLKSCFGRGLLLLPAPAPISEGGDFVLRLPAVK